eukprot:TRINITY_DN3509_c0_g1_i1.p1 TRINITY_DN3509_c0_g1~~TRINITY_DN3509_c0_g1_i1.p1  ORF type:complete len:191 (-),score=22.62 TRINITY_DN3509_c0_g1_i1:356-928(-)
MLARIIHSQPGHRMKVSALWKAYGKSYGRWRLLLGDLSDCKEHPIKRQDFAGPWTLKKYFKEHPKLFRLEEPSIWTMTVSINSENFLEIASESGWRPPEPGSLGPSRYNTQPNQVAKEDVAANIAELLQSFHQGIDQPTLHRRYWDKYNRTLYDDLRVCCDGDRTRKVDLPQITWLNPLHYTDRQHSDSL